jgi:hypothetical protein
LFHDPRSTPCGRKVREEEERGNNGVNRGHYVLHQHVQRQPLAHALPSDQNKKNAINSGHLRLPPSPSLGPIQTKQMKCTTKDTNK